MIITLIWVDDLIIATSTKILMDNAKQIFKDTFKMKDINSVSEQLHFLLILFYHRPTQSQLYWIILIAMHCMFDWHRL